MDIDAQRFRENMNRHRSLWRFTAFENILITLRPGERLILYCLSILLALSALALLVGLNNAISVTVPAKAGSMREGIIGSPRFINPILAISQADEDLTELTYSGLMRALPDGTMITDLAESYEISEDGTMYTFTIRDDARFHDGKAVTADDVLFTIALVQNPEIKSPRRVDWEGIAVSSPYEKTVVFKLQRAYAPFLENTALGMLPKRLWESYPAAEFPFSPLNTHPVGAGPYRLASATIDNTGAATSYALVPFRESVRDGAYLKKLNFRFYTNEESLIAAFNRGEIDSIAGISSGSVEKLKRRNMNIMRVPLPRIFGIFLNQGRAPIFADASVREALDVAVDKKALVENVLKGYGVILDGPIPPGIFGGDLKAGTNGAASEDEEGSAAHAERAREILARGGWKFNDKTAEWRKGKQTLSFSIDTGDAPELSGAAQILADYWRAAGMKVSVRVYPTAELNTSVIRPRAYDAILFGEVIGRTPDLFAFWHSSQRNDPGLNLAMYASSRADRLLADARTTTDRNKREELYESFAQTVAKDRPAVFLFAPEFIYVVPENIRGIELGILTTPSERFLNVHKWYTDTERIWDFFQ